MFPSFYPLYISAIRPPYIAAISVYLHTLCPCAIQSDYLLRHLPKQKRYLVPRCDVAAFDKLASVLIIIIASCSKFEVATKVAAAACGMRFTPCCCCCNMQMIYAALHIREGERLEGERAGRTGMQRGARDARSMANSAALNFN